VVTNRFGQADADRVRAALWAVLDTGEAEAA
jgi:hypothetical protein